MLCETNEYDRLKDLVEKLEKIFEECKEKL